MSQSSQSAGGRVSSDSATQSGTADRTAGLLKSAVLARGAIGHFVAPLSPLPLRAGSMPCAEVIDLYMAHYEGRDSSRVQRLSWWKQQLHALPLQELSDDHVHAALELLRNQPARYFAGLDVDGKPIHKSKGKPLSGATINRYAASLAAVITWAIKRRIAPKGFVHPCRTVERSAESSGSTRFLSDDERARLLSACRSSKWPRLYALVLLALTTGARKSELLGLRWCDVDLNRAEARCGRTKNGDPKVLPLVPAVIEELGAFAAADSTLVFASTRSRHRAYSFEPMFKTALSEAKIRNFRFHDLRHSCASMLAQSGATLLEIGDVLGHRQLAMTRRYSHLTTQHKAALVNRVLGKIS
jgi:integrase